MVAGRNVLDLFRRVPCSRMVGAAHQPIIQVRANLAAASSIDQQLLGRGRAAPVRCRRGARPVSASATWTFLLGQRPPGTAAIRSQAGHLRQVDAQATTDTGLVSAVTRRSQRPDPLRNLLDSVGPAHDTMRNVLPGAADVPPST